MKSSSRWKFPAERLVATRHLPDATPSDRRHQPLGDGRSSCSAILGPAELWRMSRSRRSGLHQWLAHLLCRAIITTP
jgi:hypothetical protein